MAQQLVILGLSGGVDSSVAAWRLLEQGYRVEAVFMQNWDTDGSDPHCPAAQDFRDARAVCELLKIKLHLVNFATEYWERVFQLFLDEYAQGRTPNPDVLCNKEIKFRAFLDYAKSLGADYLATGHYAQLIGERGAKCLMRSRDLNKDQTYFLHLLNQEQLADVLFPIGDLTKLEVRQIAKDLQLPTCQKKDSTGICFIGERKFKEFLGEYLLARPGHIVNRDGDILGEHDGLMFYTIGQRQGIGLGGQKGGQATPWYVAEKDILANQLIVTQDKNDPGLNSHDLICGEIHWISGVPPKLPFACTAQIRYRQCAELCIISSLDNRHYCVHFAQKQWAITPGQAVVFYQHEQCLGGATIEQNLMR